MSLAVSNGCVFSFFSCLQLGLSLLDQGILFRGDSCQFFFRSSDQGIFFLGNSLQVFFCLGLQVIFFGAERFDLGLRFSDQGFLFLGNGFQRFFRFSNSRILLGSQSIKLLLRFSLGSLQLFLTFRDQGILCIRDGFQLVLGFRDLSLESFFFCVEGRGQFIDLFLTAAGKTDNKCDKQNNKGEFFHIFLQHSPINRLHTRENRLKLNTLWPINKAIQLIYSAVSMPEWKEFPTDHPANHPRTSQCRPCGRHSSRCAAAC